jgi:hypothetical protein
VTTPSSQSHAVVIATMLLALGACATTASTSTPLSRVTRCPGAAVLHVSNESSQLADIYERRGSDTPRRIGTAGPGRSVMPLAEVPNHERFFSARIQPNQPDQSSTQSPSLMQVARVVLVMECL